MSPRSSRNSAKYYLVLGLIVLWAASSTIVLYAHNGSFTAPTVVAGTINVTDGTIEGAWGPGMQVGLIANDCADFMAMSGAAVNAFAANDGVNLFVAFDIPDNSANAADALFLFFDPQPTVLGGGTTTKNTDLAFYFPFTITTGAATDLSATGKSYTGVGSPNNWSAPAALPAGVQAFYRRDTVANKWQFEARFAFSVFGGFGGFTPGFAYVYMNRTNLPVGVPPAGGDCIGASVLTDFYATSSGIPAFSPPTTSLPTAVGNPSLWQDLVFGPQPPTVGFQAPLCCFTPDIDFSPAGQPFTAGVPVSIRAKPHNLNASNPANNVNVEIRVHKFGINASDIFTSGPPNGPNSAQAASIPPLTGQFTNFVVWPSPPAGIHACIFAEIKPATVSPYFIAGGSGLAQHNIDVACVPKGMKKDLIFALGNPVKNQEGLKITLIKQEVLPPGMTGLHFDLEQPARPLRPGEEVPIRLTVSADEGTPLTDVQTTKATVPPTAGGRDERGGTAPITVAVKPGDRLHITASGEVDIDGGGPLPAAPPDGKNFSAEMREGRFLLEGTSANRFAGALLGSFDGFKHSFVVGSEITLTVPEATEQLSLAVNDILGGYSDNTGKGFEVNVATLPALNAPARIASDAPGAQPAATAPTVAIPQINIAATSSSTVSVAGQDIVYHVANNYGAVTYQLLVTEHGADAGGAGVSNFYHKNRTYFYLLLLLLLLLILFFIIRQWRRKSHAS